MAGRKLLLLIDAGGESMHLLASRVRRLGYPVLRAKTTEEAKQLLCDPRYAVSAAVIPSDLPVVNLRAALAALRQVSAVEHLSFLVSGVRPPPGRRRELQEAGAEFGLWDPVDAHTLRFQINRAMAGRLPQPSRRRSLRSSRPWNPPSAAAAARYCAAVHGSGDARVRSSIHTQRLPSPRVSLAWQRAARNGPAAIGCHA